MFLLVLFAVLYIMFNFYLVIHMAVGMGNERLASHPVRLFPFFDTIKA